MRLLILGFFLCAYTGLLGQKTYSILYKGDSFQQVKRQKESKFKDSLSALNYLQELRMKAISKGFLLASIDSMHYSEKKIEVHLFLGNSFEKVHLKITDQETKILRKHIRFREKLIAEIPFKPQELSEVMQLVQRTLTSEGYPFAKVSLKDVKIINKDLYATLHADRGQEYRWKEIHIKGDSSISLPFICSLTGIKQGDLFNESQLSSVSRKLSQVSFIKEIKPFELLFTKEGVELFLYLESSPVSAINGVIGLQPNPESGRVNLTGEINLKLLNTLKRGELFDLNWRSIQAQTQSLNTRINYPFLFSSPFGIDVKFQLYKRDTTFLELRSTLGIQYFLNGGNYLKAFYQNYSSSTLSGASNNPNFTNLATIHTNSYGLELFRRTVDYLPNPSRGFSFSTEFALGSRKFQINDTSLADISTTYRSRLNVEFYIPLTARNIVRIANVTELYHASEFFENELYRFGGQQTLRGFNEEELSATARTVLTLEYRFLLDKNSNLFVFYDQGFYENNAVKYTKDYPLGFGIGSSFGTNIGIFSLSYALGKQAGNPILLSNGKIHFGYIAYF